MTNKTQIQNHENVTRKAIKKTANTNSDGTLTFTLKSDVLFKMMFVKYPSLLKKLVAQLLDIEENSLKSIGIHY